MTNNAPSSYPVGTTTVTWTVTDIHGNIATCNQTVNVNDAELPTISCPATVNVNADAGLCAATSVSLGTPTVNDNCGIASISNNAPSSYPVGTTTVTWTVTDIHGNVNTCTQTVSVSDVELPEIVCPFNITVNTDNGSCTTDATHVTLGNPLVNDNCGIATVVNDAPAVFPIGNTTVTWTVTDIHGNVNSCAQTVTVIDNQNPVILNCTNGNSFTVSTNNNNCSYTHSGTAWDATASDNCTVSSVTYVLSGATSGSGSSLDGIIFNNGTTNVIWTAIDASGLTATCSYTVIVNDSIAPVFTNCPTDISVSNDSGSCEAIVSWSAPTFTDNCGATLSSNFNSGDVFAVGTTTVIYTVTDAFGNSATCQFNVTVNDTENPVFTLCNTDIFTCDTIVTYATPTASDNCGILSLVQTAGLPSGSVFPVGTTTIVYQATDIHGNSSTCSFNVTVYPLPVITGIVNDVVCNAAGNGTIDITVSNGTSPYNFNWSNSEITEDISNLIPGNYQVTITDNNTCTATASYSVNEPAALTIQSIHTNLNCYGSNDGGISVHPNGGVSPYSYLWNTGDTTQNLNNIAAGTYVVTVTDFNLCSLNDTITVTQPDSIEISSTVLPATCLSNNGSMDITVIGGTMPYSYVWSSGETTQDIENSAAGIYSVTVTDGKGCTQTFTDSITSISVISINASIRDVKCYGDSTGSIDVTPISGVAPYTYVWNTGATTEDLNNLAAGVYDVQATDANGCHVDMNFVIAQSDSLYITLSSPEYTGGFNISHNGYSDGSIDLTVVGGTSPYSYLWSNGETTEDINQLTAGTYSILLTDDQGCTVGGQITLDEPLPIDMPTGYSPNEDGKNDFFVIHGIEVFPDNEIFVYNRWGNLVYSEVGYNNNWNGYNNNGEKLPDATYFVILNIKGENSFSLTGYVDVRR